MSFSDTCSSPSSLLVFALGLTIGLGQEGLSVHCAEGSHFIGQRFIFFKFVVHASMLPFVFTVLSVSSFKRLFSCFTQFVVLNKIKFH